MEFWRAWAPTVGGAVSTDRQSFEDLQRVWIPDLLEMLWSIDTILIDNRSDCSPSERRVSTEEAEAMAQKLGTLYFETSAKNDVNVTEAIRTMSHSRDYRLHLPIPSLANASS